MYNLLSALQYFNTYIWQSTQCSVAKVDYRGAAAPKKQTGIQKNMLSTAAQSEDLYCNKSN